jgi:hypothetical protein
MAGNVVAERRQPKLADERGEARLPCSEPRCSELERRTVGEPARLDPAADALPRLENDRGPAGSNDVRSRDEPREACADDDDVGVGDQPPP